MKKLISLFLSSAILLSSSVAFAKSDISVKFNGATIDFEHSPIIINDRTMIHLRSFSDIFGCSLSWDNNARSVHLTNDELDAVIRIDNPEITVVKNGEETKSMLEVSPMIVNDVTFIPLRAIAEIFETEISWNNEERTVEIEYDIDDEEIKKTHTFYFQNEEKWQLPEFGSGYCWVVCYAMVLNNLLGNVTPPDVALVNYEMCENGAYCYHYQIAERFGVKFSKAIDENSPYYESFQDGYATYINNPQKDDLIAVNAIKEALDNHPEGIMIRFNEYPHTIVATGYEGNTIVFNEPQPSKWGEYSETSLYEGVTFDKTYPYSKGLTLSDLTFLQAINLNK